MFKVTNKINFEQVNAGWVKAINRFISKGIYVFLFDV